jgi:hypothetical protein
MYEAYEQRDLKFNNTTNTAAVFLDVERALDRLLHGTLARFIN